MIQKKQRALLICTALIFMLFGCASAPKPTLVQVALSAQANVNPDSRGRPSPIVVRFYELKTPTAFNNADFFFVV